jgi:hypothetical protein
VATIRYNFPKENLLGHCCQLRTGSGGITTKPSAEYHYKQSPSALANTNFDAKSLLLGCWARIYAEIPHVDRIIIRLHDLHERELTRREGL